MKKLFTLAAAVLASMAMMAAYEPTADEVIIFNNVYSASATDAGYSTHDAISWEGTVSFSDKKAGDPANGGELTSSNVKTCSAKGNGSGKNLTISVEGCSGIILYHEKQASRYVEFRDGGKTGTLLATSASNATYTEVALDASKAYSIFLHGIKDDGGDQDLYVYAVKLIKGADDGNPAMSVDKAEVELAATAAVPAPSVKVKFTGKNLAAGEYNLTVPNLAGLTVAPLAVTVGEDGKLNQEVTITYAPVADANGSTAISLTIGELSKTVTVNYSAVMAKEYATSLNIEQLVLDNGKSANIVMALEAAHIDYANIDALDSLNDEKANRNYPFLGLKLKKTDATIGLWVKAGSTLKVRFGNVGESFKVALNGVESTLTNALANATVADANVYEFTAEADTYVLFTCASTKTLVFKQIMIDEDIKAVVLPSGTAIDNTEVEAKAVKAIENGMLVIEKNGVRYNVMGQIVR